MKLQTSTFTAHIPVESTIGAVAFSYWVGSWAAGIFVFFTLAALWALAENVGGPQK